MHSSVTASPAPEAPRWTRSLAFRLACVLWLVAAQVWYYWQFRWLLRSAIVPLLYKLWRS